MCANVKKQYGSTTVSKLLIKHDSLAVQPKLALVSKEALSSTVTEALI